MSDWLDDLSKVAKPNYGLSQLESKLDAMRLAIESVDFCLQVRSRYRSNEPANEHMDADKADEQLTEAIRRLLKVWNDSPE